VGYLLRPGFLLPPLMFSEEEIEALVLGTRWVAERTDSRLADAARNALARIAAVLPPDLRQQLDTGALLVGPPDPAPLPDGETLATLRRAIRLERKIDIRYLDLKGRESQRIVWPFALGFFDRARVLAAWCETRQEFRHFRADRIAALTLGEERYPRRRQVLLQAWRQVEGIALP
jgi:predicted DNA-binding transcriptional regulator YafY